MTTLISSKPLPCLPAAFEYSTCEAEAGHSAKARGPHYAFAQIFSREWSPHAIELFPKLTTSTKEQSTGGLRIAGTEMKGIKVENIVMAI